MTFLNPLVLFGLIAAAIPLLIHLFNFRRPRKIDFSSLVFLRELQQTTMQRVKIKQWLLLLLRTLAIAALVLSFARPTLQGSVARILGGEAESASVLVLDNSLSMSVRDVDGVLLDQAKAAAREFADVFRSGDQVAILPTGGGGPQAIRWLKSRAAITEEIEDVRPSTSSVSIADAITHAGELLESTSYVNREIFVLSDFQASTLGDSLSTLPAGIPVRLAKIGDQSWANTSVRGIRIASQIVEPGRPVRIEATLTAGGTESATSILASVYLDGDRSAQADVDVRPDALSTVDFVVTPRRTGWLEGWVEIEDDSFPADNRRYFSLAVPETRSVLMVAGDDVDARYVVLALSTEVAPGRTRFDLDTVTGSGLSARRLGDYDVVILAGIGHLSSGQVSALASYVEGGGGLLLFPSTSRPSDDLNNVLSRLGGGRIEGIVQDPRARESVATIESADIEHPLFEGVFQRAGSQEVPRLEQLDVYRFAAYRTTNAAEVTLLRLSTGQAFLQEIPVGRGKVLFQSVLPVPEWSELPRRGLFVPLLYRSLSYLSAGESPAGETLQIGRTVDIRLAGATEADIIRIVGADAEIVPAQRPSFGGMLVTAGQGISDPGIYDVMIGDRRVRKLSANLDPVESDPRSLDATDAAEALRGARDADVRALSADFETEGRFAAAVATMRSGIELWNVFLGVALVFLVAEMLVSRLWKPASSA